MVTSTPLAKVSCSSEIYGFSQSSGYWVYVLWLIHIKIPWLGPAVHIKKHSSPSAPQLCSPLQVLLYDHSPRARPHCLRCAGLHTKQFMSFSYVFATEIYKIHQKVIQIRKWWKPWWDVVVLFGGRDQQQGHAWHLLHPGYRWYIPLGHDAMREVGPWDMLNDLQLPTGPPSATTPSGWWFKKKKHLEKWWSESQWEGWHPIWNGK